MGWWFCFVRESKRADARFQDIYSTMYSEYKLSQGYSENEIVAKMLSLKGVLEPFSMAGNQGLLERAGFRDIVPIFSISAFKACWQSNERS